MWWNGFRCVRNLFCVVLLTSVQIGETARQRNRMNVANGCEFPTRWTGLWYQRGAHLPVRIEKDLFSIKGKCLQADGQTMFFVEDRPEKCFRCIAIYEKHPNVLQYRETYCSNYKTMSKACSGLNADAPLYSLFRLDASPVPCQLQGPYQFSYSRGGRGECDYPVSSVDTCTDDTRLLFRFQACAEVIGTESSVEELTCLAVWKEGAAHYMVGKMTSLKSHSVAFRDDNAYRCFIFDFLSDGEIQMSQSADATCDGLVSPWEGSKTMRLTRTEHPTSQCHYPKWVTSTHRWHTLDNRRIFTFGHMNNTFRMSYTHPDQEETKFTCIEEIETTTNFSKMVAYGMSGCENGYVCMKFFKRHDHIIEIQMSNYARSLQEACQSSFGVTFIQEYVTLVSPSLPSMGCPQLAGSNGMGIQIGRSPSTFASEVCKEASPAAVVVGCRSEERIQFRTTCSTVEDLKSFHCHGHWEDNGRSYLVTGLHDAKTKYCFVYWSTDKTTHLTGIHDTCRRTLELGVTGNFTFNISAAGHCDSVLDPNSADFLSRSSLSIVSLVVLSISTLFLR